MQGINLNTAQTDSLQRMLFRGDSTGSDKTVKIKNPKNSVIEDKSDIVGKFLADNISLKQVTHDKTNQTFQNTPKPTLEQLKATVHDNDNTEFRNQVDGVLRNLSTMTIGQLPIRTFFSSPLGLSEVEIHRMDRLIKRKQTRLADLPRNTRLCFVDRVNGDIKRCTINYEDTVNR